MATRILVVDDEPDLLELLAGSFEDAGYAVDTAATAGEALDALRERPPDVLVLDWMLPDMPGTEVCRHVRAHPELAGLPVLMLTARSEEVDRIVGFELGADDYVTKPFSPRELLLRVRALLRRRSPAAAGPRTLARGPLRLDLDRHRCFVDHDEVTLTAKEFGLLAQLLEHPGRVHSRDRLLDCVWGRDVHVTSRTIDTHVKRLREKLGEAGALIETVRGVGYRLAE